MNDYPFNKHVPQRDTHTERNHCYPLSWLCYFLDFLFFLDSSSLDVLRSFRVVITPLTIIGRDIPNRITTNSFGMSDTASSAVFPESSEVIIIWKIIVGINQTHNPKISQYSPFNDFLLLDHFIIWEPLLILSLNRFSFSIYFFKTITLYWLL